MELYKFLDANGCSPIIGARYPIPTDGRAPMLPVVGGELAHGERGYHLLRWEGLAMYPNEILVRLEDPIQPVEVKWGITLVRTARVVEYYPSWTRETMLSLAVDALQYCRQFVPLVSQHHWAAMVAQFKVLAASPRNEWFLHPFGELMNNTYFPERLYRVAQRVLDMFGYYQRGAVMGSALRDILQFVALAERFILKQQSGIPLNKAPAQNWASSMIMYYATGALVPHFQYEEEESHEHSPEAQPAAAP